MLKAFEQLLEFTSRVDEAARFDEAHLLPIAMEVFEQASFPVRTEYVSIRKTRNSKTLVTARRLYFESYYSFIITDFFEGLHYGHYPKQCPICKKYFLMQSAARQKILQWICSISTQRKTYYLSKICGKNQPQGIGGRQSCYTLIQKSLFSNSQRAKAWNHYS